MKKIFLIFIIFLMVALALFIIKDAIVKMFFERAVGFIAGTRLNIVEFKVDMAKHSIDIGKFRLLNPEGYKDNVMADVPEIRIIYDLNAIGSGKIYFPELSIYMKQFLVIKNRKGELNLNSLKIVKAAKEKKQLGSENGMHKIQVDKLRIKIGEVVFKDYSKSLLPVVKVYEVNIDQQFENIKDAYTLIRLIIVRALRNTKINEFAEFPFRSLDNALPRLIDNTKQTFKMTLGEIEKTAGILEGVILPDLPGKSSD